MVDPQHFERVRIVQDKGIDTLEELPEHEEGTKVVTDVLEATGDSLFPLRGALGYEIYQTLFIGPNSLVVEGVSDLLYIQTISGLLQRQGRDGLSPKWTITPVGGAERVPTFVTMIGVQKGLRIGTLIDIQKKDRQNIQNLYKRKLLKKKNVFTFANFVEGDEADIEDMFERDFYLGLVNGEYKDELTAPIKADELDGNLPRVLVRIEKHLEANSVKGQASFNHYRPARYLAENVAAMTDKISESTLARFQSAFDALNELL